MSRLIAVADCETDPFKIGRVPKPFIWGFYDGERYVQFDARRGCTRKFIEFIKDQPLILYAHNGGKFDWHFVLPYLEAYGDIMIINGRIAKAQVGLCELRDSYNILPVPLAAYKKDEIDYAIMEPGVRHKPANWKKICSYLRSDCVYLHELVSAFIDKYGVQITQASAAMAQWKKVSGKKVPQSSKEFYDLISPYYYGGRVQCFESGIIDTKFSVYDINSAYPEAMMHQHPYSTEYSHVEKFVEGADFYKVRCVSHGAFPYRGDGSPDSNSGLHFPSDDVVRIYTVTGWEYQAAIETKSVEKVKVMESFVFSQRTDFAAYIEHFYRMRLQAKAEKNDAESLFAKLLMNSLYGKFASNPENYRHFMVVPMDVIAGLESQGWEFAGELGPWGLAQAPLAEEEQHYYNVATGASITGYVRAKLWRSICSCKGVLYCDTDSVAARTRGAAVVLGDALGAWKCEGQYDRAGIAGKKLYIFRGVQTRKGREYKMASKGARLTQSELWNVARGGVVLYMSDVPTFSVNKAPEFLSRKIRKTTVVSRAEFDEGELP